MDFVALDVETANSDKASICQIGIAKFSGDQLVDEWSSLVNPNDKFSRSNVKVHGIKPEAVLEAPTMPDLAGDLASHLSGVVCVTHTGFDRIALRQAFEKYSLTPPEVATWLDSAAMARRAWENAESYGLAKLCELIDHDLAHHDALEDAKAAGHVVLAVVAKTGCGLSEWIETAIQPLDLMTAGSALNLDGKPEGDFAGEIMVFTGALNISHQEAADLANSIGCTVAPSVTKKTTVLVVGDQDLSRLAGQAKSSKHRKAEQLIAAGQAIRILGESSFKTLVAQALKIG